MVACRNAEDWDILAGDRSIFGALSARYLRDLESGDVAPTDISGPVAKDCGQETLASDRHSFCSEELVGMAARDEAFRVRRTNPGPGRGLSVADPDISWLAILAALEPCNVREVHRTQTVPIRRYCREES